MKSMTRQLLLTFLLLSAGGMFAQDKLAQTGFQFLSVVSDARGAALASTMATTEMHSSALFFNPATMATSEKAFDASFSLNEWIADIRHNNVSLSIAPNGGQYGVFGLSMQVVDYGEILGTVATNTVEQGYLDIGELDAGAFATGLGYAKRLNDRFSVGGQVKYVMQDLGRSVIPASDSTKTTAENDLGVMAFDFGTYYQTGFRSLAIGFAVRNFSQEVSFVRQGFQLPLTFNIGVSMNLFDLTAWDSEQQSVMFAVQANNARSRSEQVSFALEYIYRDLISLRGGYVTEADENDVTFGLGVAAAGITVDYAYTPFGLFDNVQRFSVRFTF